MDSRGRKRTDAGEILPVDKRACSSSEFHAPASPVASSPPPPAESEASPPPSVEEHVNDDVNDDDNDNDDDDYEDDEDSDVDDETRTRVDQLAIDIGSGDEAVQIAALSELANMLLFTTVQTIDDVLPRLNVLVPALLKTLAGDGSGEVVLISASVVYYLCDMIPGCEAAVVRHGAVPVLCQRLLEPELDVGEKCLRSLERISKVKPVECLEAGAVMACLTYFDFFAITVQKVALSTVANMCKEISPSYCPLIVDSISTLFGVLHCEDDKLVETAATCLRRIVEGLRESSEKLDQICKNELVSQCGYLITSNQWITIGKKFNEDLMIVFSSLASHSPEVVKTLLRLDISASISNTLKTFYGSMATGSHSVLVNSHSNQVLEVFKLLHQLLPPFRGWNDNAQTSLAKERIYLDEPHLLQQFALNIFPLLIQMVNSGTTSCLKYGCLSIMRTIAYFSAPDALLNILNGTNISSFLANMLSDNNEHMLVAALHITDILLQKHPDMFFHQFVREGVAYAIDLLSKLGGACKTDDQPRPEQTSSISQTATNSVCGCLCYAFDLFQSSQSQMQQCKARKATAFDLASAIKSTYFTSSVSRKMDFNEILNVLKTFCSVLNDNVQKFSKMDYNAENEEYLAHILDQIIYKTRLEDTSTFEFLESGIAESFLNYLCDGRYLPSNLCSMDFQCRPNVVLERCRTFATIMSSQCFLQRDDMVLTVVVRKLQSTLSSHGKFPVISCQPLESRGGIYADIPYGRTTSQPCFQVRFVGVEGGSAHVINVEPSSSFDAIEEYLLIHIAAHKPGTELTAEKMNENVDQLEVNKSAISICENVEHSELHAEPRMSASIVPKGIAGELHQLTVGDRDDTYIRKGSCVGGMFSIRHTERLPKLKFYLDGKQIDRSLTFYQAIIQQEVNFESDVVLDNDFWSKVREVSYKSADLNETGFKSVFNHSSSFWETLPFFSSLLAAQLPCKLERKNQCYDLLFLLSTLEGMNKYICALLSTEERAQDFSDLSVVEPLIHEREFLSSKLSEKLEKQMADNFSSLTGNMPAWFSWLVTSCPFMFSFKARCKFFRITLLASSQKNHIQRPNQDNNYRNLSVVSQSNQSRKKFVVDRGNILESAKTIMDLTGHSGVVLEVEYDDEVGTGIGPTLEFFTLVSQALQEPGLGLWRGYHCQSTCTVYHTTGEAAAPTGLFPRPWSTMMNSSNKISFSKVLMNFRVLGWLIARALYDRRVIDLQLSKAFYKLILEQELDICDISLFDPELGKSLLEFRSLAISKQSSEGSCEIHFRGIRIEDLCIDFALPGYPDYVVRDENDSKMVNSANLEEFISLVVDASIGSGISRQTDAFKAGFNEVFPLKSLCIFSVEELEMLLCGEQDTWTFEGLIDNIKFDHGYTVRSPQVLNFLEIIQQFHQHERRAFLQFVTGAPRLPPGGLATLNPKLTVVRKHVNDCADMHLPSVMTCANYLKLPPYSSKEKMREKLLYAITEGQGSFHLS